MVLTLHAQERMAQRAISMEEMRILVERGGVKWKDDTHLWLYKDFPDRDDNLVCAAAMLNNVLVIKTVMIRWEEA